jgi:NAD-dependent DNA ligase
VPIVEQAIADGVLDEDERQDIIWLCEKLRSTEYFNETTADLQVLHGILGGIASDGAVTKEELNGLSEWLSGHDHLRTCWPYDEVDSLITSVLADGKIDEVEQKFLQRFFSEFISVLDDKTITSPVMTKDASVEGVCAACPEITFEGSTFCFTGASNRLSRAEFEQLVARLGGRAATAVSNKLNYLVIGAEGNQCWAYACYGRKVEKAVELRKQGARLLIVHENDFHDAVADAG